MNFEHSYSDGLGWARFIHEVMCDIQGKQDKLPKSAHPAPPAHVRAPFCSTCLPGRAAQQLLSPALARTASPLRSLRRASLSPLRTAVRRGHHRTGGGPCAAEGTDCRTGLLGAVARGVVRGGRRVDYGK